jgi:hypothetical protein
MEILGTSFAKEGFVNLAGRPHWFQRPEQFLAKGAQPIFVSEYRYEPYHDSVGDH